MGRSAVLSFCGSRALVSRSLCGSAKSYQAFASGFCCSSTDSCRSALHLCLDLLSGLRPFVHLFSLCPPCLTSAYRCFRFLAENLLVVLSFWLSHLLLSYTRLAGTPLRLFRHRQIKQKQQVRFTGARCCDGGDNAGDSAGSDHSSYDSGHSHSSYDSGHSHAAHHGSSTHGSSSNPDHGSNSDHRSSKHSKHDQEDSKQGHNKISRKDSEDDDFLSDSALDIVSMFDTTETGNTSVEYRPSSGTYYKPPTGTTNLRQPTNPDFWAYKPVWCQPWSIISTGIAFVAGARWVTGGSTIATVVAAVPILVWWYVFLILVPGDFREYADNDK